MRGNEVRGIITLANLQGGKAMKGRRQGRRNKKREGRKTMIRMEGITRIG